MNGWGALIAAIITGGLALVAAIIKFVPSRNQNHLPYKEVGDTVRRIEEKINNGEGCRAGTSKTCIDHATALAGINTAIPEIKESVGKIDGRMEQLHNDLHAWMRRNGTK